MHIATSRFGSLRIENDDVIHFPAGIIGMESCCDWVLLADAENDALGWLQSTERADLALPVVSPRRFLADYQIRVARQELASLELDDMRDAQALVIVGRNENGPTLNLKAPIVFNLAQRLAAQVVVKDDHALQYELSTQAAPLKKSA